MTVNSGNPVYASDINILTDAENSELPQGAIARGKRTTNTGTITTTETGVLRIDSIPVYAGRIYKISTSNVNIDTSVDNDVGTCRLRVSTSGSATTSSTIIATLRNTIDNASQSNLNAIVGFYYPASDGTLSVLLSCLRQAGTGNLVVFCNSTDYLDMVVTDEGIAPPDTGVVI